jgi:predicted TIM-barrel enzyme
MAGWTNRGKYNTLAEKYRAATAPTNYFVALVTSATAPAADHNTLSELTEIAANNGYTSGGYSLARNATDFDVLTEDDSNDRALVQIKDVVWTASGGPIPASGNGARYAVLLDDNATVGSREIDTYWDLASDRSVSDGQTLTLQNLEIRINES